MRNMLQAKRMWLERSWVSIMIERGLLVSVLKFSRNGQATIEDVSRDTGTILDL